MNCRIIIDGPYGFFFILWMWVQKITQLFASIFLSLIIYIIRTKGTYSLRVRHTWISMNTILALRRNTMNNWKIIKHDFHISWRSWTCRQIKETPYIIPFKQVKCTMAQLLNHTPEISHPFASHSHIHGSIKVLNQWLMRLNLTLSGCFLGFRVWWIVFAFHLPVNWATCFIDTLAVILSCFLFKQQQAFKHNHFLYQVLHLFGTV